MNRREFLKHCPGAAVAAVAMLSGGCHYWGIFKEEMSRSNDMLIKPFIRKSFLTWNINAGLGLDGKRDLARIAKVVKDADMPIVALQEIDRKTKRAGGEDQFEQLEKLLEMKGHWCCTSKRDEGEIGMALFLEDASLKSETVKLPGDGAMIGVKFPEFAVGAVNFPVQEADRMAALAKLSGMIEADRPLFLLGDWGDEIDGEFMLKLRRSFPVLSGFAKTYPADDPVSCSDHVAVSQRHRLRYEHVKHEVLPEAVASDHRPLMVSAW